MMNLSASGDKRKRIGSEGSGRKPILSGRKLHCRGNRLPNLRPLPGDAAVILTVALLAAILAAAVLHGDPWAADRSTAVSGGNRSPLWAVVYMDGDEADRTALDTGKPPFQRTYTGNGYTVVAEFCPDGMPGVRILSSDCPNQDCVHMGIITRAGQCVVCLPSRIVIRLEGGAAVSDGPDAVLG